MGDGGLVTAPPQPPSPSPGVDTSYPSYKKQVEE